MVKGKNKLTQESTNNVKEYVVEISFFQPVETAVLMLASSPEEAKDVVTKLFHKRQDLVIASINEKPKGYRDPQHEETMTMETTTNNVTPFPVKKDLN